MERARRLATVLFTDLVGSTERATQLGDRRWRALLEQHHGRVRRELRSFGGREVGTAGDGFLATFDSPARAIHCACAIRDSVRDLGLQVRCGLHMGEVELTGRDVGGIAVHIGARVGAQAGPGEVLVSSTVRDAVEGSGFEFDDRSLHALKGVRGEWRLFAVSGLPEGVEGRVWWPARLPRPRTLLAGAMVLALVFGLAGLYVVIRDRGRSFSPPEAIAEGAGPGIAVLPFTVRGAGLEVWQEGMVDLLSTNLDGVAGLRAIDSRTVLARWGERVQGDAAPDLATMLDVANRTGARYALVGSVLASGRGVRLAAELLEVKDGATLERAQVEGAPDSIFGLVDRLSIEVLRAILKGEESALSRVSLARITTASLPALKAYLEGETFFRRSDFEGAVRAYERAVTSDSTFALALYRLGTAYRWRESYFSDAHRQYLERAARFSDHLPESEALLMRGVLALDKGTLDGLPVLEQAVRRHPDDAEAWYLLGETYYHLGARALVAQEESERAFFRAMELDPSFTPAYIHVVENAFQLHADSARAAKLVATYGQLAGASESDRMNRLAFALAFGDAAERDRARAAVDTLPSPFLWFLVGNYFEHPRLREMQREILVVLRERPSDRGVATMSLFWNALSRGRLEEAIGYLEDPGTPQPLRAFGLYNVYVRGMPLSPGRLERELDTNVAEGAPWFASFYAGAYAADRGEWAKHAAALGRLQKGAEHSLVEGNVTVARNHEEAAEALQGYGLWKRGRRAEALRSLEALQRRADFLNDILRWWLGKLLLEMERPREAERYFRSFWQDPLAAYYLGKINEELEEPAKAREAYALFLYAWREADPALEPLVRDAQSAVARLGQVVPRMRRPSARGRGTGAADEAPLSAKPTPAIG
jgi:class 3 adenylate cyclase/tetratricopeptide (TPR) repeat protein